MSKSEDWKQTSINKILDAINKERHDLLDLASEALHKKNDLTYRSLKASADQLQELRYDLHLIVQTIEGDSEITVLDMLEAIDEDCLALSLELTNPEKSMVLEKAFIRENNHYHFLCQQLLKFAMKVIEV